MADINMEKPLTRELMSIAAEMEREGVTEITSRIATIKLDNGLEAQVHVTVTTETDDFLELT